MRLSLAFAALLLTPPAAALAEGKADAKAHIQKATAAHKEGRFDEAKTELEAAYALDPQPQLQYALGQVNVKLGRCEDAITHYERFLQSKPTAAAADAANQAIVTCRVAITQAQAKSVPEPSDAPPPVVEDPEPTPGTTVPAPAIDVVSPTPWYKDKLGLSLVGAGTVSAIASVVLYTSARSKLDDAEAAMTYGEAEGLVDDAKSTRTLSVVFAGAGAALVAGGIVYYLTRDTQHEAQRVSVTPTTSGGLITLFGRF